MHDLVRIAALFGSFALVIGGTRMFRTGSILVKDTEEPGYWIHRRERPFAFWSFVTCFYLVAVLMGVSAVFAPSI